MDLGKVPDESLSSFSGGTIMKKFGLSLAALAMSASLFAATRSVTLSVKGWTCGACAAATRIALKKLDGVKDVAIDTRKAQAVVTYDEAKVAPEKMIGAVDKLGYVATVESAAAASGSSSPSENRAAAARPRPASLSQLTASAKEAPQSPERVSFFEVPLECPAAEGLGCGSLTKPILKAIDRDSRVREAKVNYPGSLLAVAWKDPGEARSGAQAVEAVFRTRGLETAVLEGAAREKALRQYESTRWYGAADVDCLSEHEARVIAARLVNRAKGGLGLSPQKLQAFEKDLSRGIAAILTRDKGDDCARDPFEGLTVIARKYLNEQQIAELREAAQRGVDALPGER
jgi:periplasmic mercuric ion binding protein